MYIKLTRFDNRPVWINAAFVVTVEPRKEGVGAVVVPIGDGFDYDVRESPEDVLRMLEGCVAPQVVPVPIPDCLTKTPDDVSPEPEEKPVAEVVADEEKPPVRKAIKQRKPAASKRVKSVKNTSSEMSDEDVARLGKLAPKSVAKLRNTLSSQFRVADVAETVAALETKGLIKIDGNHVDWIAG